MKYLRFLLILLLIPFIVLAEECDTSKITITSMEQSNIEGNTEELSTPTYKDRNIKLNLKMYDVGDFITYDMTIKNESDEDYMINEDTFKTDSDYIEYSLKTNDNSNVVKAQSTKAVSLIVTYKKEVEEDKLINNKFNASNSLKLSLNTSEKEKELDIITTDNIKESLDPKEVKNPITNVSSMLLISLILLTTIITTYILIKRKNKYTKFIVLILSIVLIPTVYAICEAEIEVESNIEINHIPSLYNNIVEISNEENSCVLKYEGNVTDEVGKTVPATNVYFNNCLEKRNVIFGGFCWQIIRTTQTGGTKLVYNGEPIDGKCESNRDDHLGIISPNGSYLNLSSEYLYGSYFTFNTENNTFTLKDTSNHSWSNTTYEDIIGKYTCKNNSNTCSTIYSVNSYKSNTEAYTTAYSIGSTSYSSIGASPFNANNHSIAMIGYMYNKVYNYLQRKPGTNTYKYSSTFTYDDDTNMYTLAGNNQIFSDWNIAYNKLNNTHYTCWNSSGTCSTLSYIYYANPGNTKGAYYLNMTDGKGINDIISEMLEADNVNLHSSSIKQIIDSWYEKYLTDYTEYLEDTVYCGARNIISLGAWNPDGGKTAEGEDLEFKNSDLTTDLSCSNITDQFAVSNNKAKLTYRVALVNHEEWYNFGDSAKGKALRVNKNWYWDLSPGYITYLNSAGRTIDSSGFANSRKYVNYSGDIRPAITLINTAKISSGTGSEEDPWIIE